MRGRSTFPALALLALAALLVAARPASAVVDDRVDLNNAEAADFERFGDTLEDVDVERILQARVDSGDFKRVEEIVDLIGLDKFTEIQDDLYVTVTRERVPAKIGGSARFEVRARDWNAADPLIKSRTSYEDGPEYRREFELNVDDRFEGYMRLKRSSWLKTNSEYVYDRRVAWNTWDIEKVEKRRRKAVRVVKQAGESRSPETLPREETVDASPTVTGWMIDRDIAVVPPDSADGEDAAGDAAAGRGEDAAAGEEGSAGDEPEAEDAGATDEESEDEDGESEGATAEATDEVALSSLPLHLVTRLERDGGAGRKRLLADARGFADGTAPVALEFRFAAAPAGEAAASLEEVETGEGLVRLALRIRRAATPVGTEEAGLAGAAPAALPVAAAGAFPVAPEAVASLASSGGTVEVVARGTAPVTLEGSVEAMLQGTAAVALQGTDAVALQGTAAVALQGTDAVALAGGVEAALRPAAPPVASLPAISAALTLERVSGGRAEDELLHRSFALGTAESELAFTLTVRAAAGEGGPPHPMRILKTRVRKGVVTLRVESTRPAATLLDPASDDAAEALEADEEAKGDDGKAKRAKKKKVRKGGKTRKGRKARRAKKGGDGLAFPASRVRRVRETTVEVTLVDRKVLRSRLELGNVTMAPVRKPLLAYTSTLAKRGVKYAHHGDGWRDALLYARATDENERLYGNQYERDLPGGGVVGTQLYRVECATEGRAFTNLNLYAKAKLDETKVEAEYGRVEGGADAIYLKTDTRVKKLNVYTIFNSIDPRYDDEEAAEPFSMTRFQEYTSAYLKALWRPDRKVAVTARKSLYAKGEVDGQNGESRNAADTWYFRYAVTDALALRADLYRTISTGLKEGNTLRLRAFWDATKRLRLEASAKTYDYNAAAGSTSRKNAEHALYAAWRARPGLTVKAKGERENQDDRDVLTNTAGFEWKLAGAHYLEFEAENERISGKLVPTVQIETLAKARYVYKF